MSAARPIDDEVAAILADQSKRISDELRWTDDEDASGHEFLAPVTCAAGELQARGQRCPAAGTLRFALISRGIGRLAALDLGPDGLRFHRWAPGRRDAITGLPADSSPPLDERSAWRLFCRLDGITHDGELADAPPTQEPLL